MQGFIPYLNFQGQCAEAFAFYGEVFGAEPQIMRFRDVPAGDMPPLPEERRDWAVHASLDCDDGRLMGSDAPPEFGGKPQAGVSISLTRPDADTARALFERLAEGGEVSMPFGETFFSKGFGMCRDRFGTHWMVTLPDVG